MTDTTLARRDSLAEIGADDLVDRIAKEIGKSVAAHIEAMYPDAAAAVAWSSCARSIEGTVRNMVKSAGKAAEEGDAEAWLAITRRNRLAEAKRAKEARQWGAEDDRA